MDRFDALGNTALMTTRTRHYFRWSLRTMFVVVMVMACWACSGVSVVDCKATPIVKGENGSLSFSWVIFERPPTWPESAWRCGKVVLAGAGLFAFLWLARPLSHAKT
jgi:hypothetical protein